MTNFEYFGLCWNLNEFWRKLTKIIWVTIILVIFGTLRKKNRLKIAKIQPFLITSGPKMQNGFKRPNENDLLQDTFYIYMNPPKI